MGVEVVHLRFHARSLQLVGIEGITLDGIFVGHSLGTRQLIETVVGLRCHHVVLYLDDLSGSRSYQGSGMVSVSEVQAG